MFSNEGQRDDGHVKRFSLFVKEETPVLVFAIIHVGHT